MKINHPIVDLEIPFRDGIIVTRTDAKGAIVYANDRFCEMSGFTREELVGKNHNVVRHPDMPPEAFKDLWDTVKRDRPWQGIVKNRAKDGRFYWVNAFVVPVKKNGQTTGYMSVRRPPSQSMISAADALYRSAKNGGKIPATKQPSRRNPIMDVLGIGGIIIPSIVAGYLSGSWVGGLCGVVAASFAIAQLVASKSREANYERLRKVCMSIAEGNLQNKLDIGQPGLIGEWEESLAYMQIHLAVMVEDIQYTARVLAESSAGVVGNLSVIYDKMETGSEHIAAMSAAIEQLSAAIEMVAQNANRTSTCSAQAHQDIIKCETDVVSNRKNVQAASESVQHAQGTVSELSSAIDAITNVTNTIRDIADQTNLLALNAAIEAARAGETGRGFAVVADEVRKLAERTSSSTDQINSLVANVHNAAVAAIDTMTTIAKATQDGLAAQENTAGKLIAVRKSTVEVDDMMREVATSNVQQSQATSELALKMAEVSNQVSHTHDELSDAVQGIKQLQARSKELSTHAEHFII